MRENLAELHTAEAWKMKEGREVTAGELSKPAKEVKRRGYKPSGKDRPLDLEDDQVSPPGLYSTHYLLPCDCRPEHAVGNPPLIAGTQTFSNDMHVNSPACLLHIRRMLMPRLTCL